MFYGVENKVYLHNLGTNITYEMTNIDLSANEEVTMLKFNLYHNNYWWPGTHWKNLWLVSTS